MASLSVSALNHATQAKTNNYFLDHNMTPEEMQALRSSTAYRFAIDIIAKTNATYKKYLSYGDMRLRIIAHSPMHDWLWLGDTSGATMAKVYLHPKTLDYCFHVGRNIKERGPDTDIIQSKKTSVVIRTLFDMKGHNEPRLLRHMREVWDNNVYLIDQNLGFGARRVLSDNNCQQPTQNVTMARAVAKYLVANYTNPSEAVMPNSAITQAIEQHVRDLEREENFVSRADELAKEAFDCERWMVIRSEPGYYIGSVKTDPEVVLINNHDVRNTQVVRPFVFVRKFEELANISTDLHEQFMGAFVMMRAAEPSFNSHSKAYNDPNTPFTDYYFKNTTAITYYRSQAMDGGISLSFRALPVVE
jgi:hypothetical protein